MLEEEAERWLLIQRNLRRAPNTLLAYRRSLESYRSFCFTLQTGGKLEIAQYMAGHESARTTGLYDRRSDEVALDEVERIAF